MQFFIIAALFAAASAVPYAGLVNTGNSAVSRSEDGYGNYAFGYNEDHATGGTFRKEQGGPHGVVGSYGLRDIDGRMRTVNYVADALGYRASVSTNEPGTDVKQDPAAVNMNYGGAVLAAPVLAAPVAAYAAPIISKAAYAAPVAYGSAYGSYGAPISSSYGASIQHISAPVIGLQKSYGVAPALAGHGYGYNAYNKLY